MEEEKIIESLNKNTAQLADWQFRETIVEKINECIMKVNDVIDIVKKIKDEDDERKEIENKDNDLGDLLKEKREEEETAKREEERIAKEKEEKDKQRVDAIKDVTN